MKKAAYNIVPSTDDIFAVPGLCFALCFMRKPSFTIHTSKAKNTVTRIDMILVNGMIPHTESAQTA